MLSKRRTETNLNIGPARPGAKLFEELLIDGEVTRTLHPRIWQIKKGALDVRTLDVNPLRARRVTSPSNTGYAAMSGLASASRFARIAGMPLEAFMVEMGRAGIPVIRGSARTLREDLKNLKAWRAR